MGGAIRRGSAAEKNSWLRRKAFNTSCCNRCVAAPCDGSWRLRLTCAGRLPEVARPSSQSAPASMARTWASSPGSSTEVRCNMMFLWLKWRFFGQRADDGQRRCLQPWPQVGHKGWCSAVGDAAQPGQRLLRFALVQQQARMIELPAKVTADGRRAVIHGRLGQVGRHFPALFVKATDNIDGLGMSLPCSLAVQQQGGGAVSSD